MTSQGQHRLWADFADIEESGDILVEIPEGLELETGDRLVLFDHEGNRCDAEQVSSGPSGFIVCRLLWDTWASESPVPLPHTATRDHISISSYSGFSVGELLGSGRASGSTYTTPDPQSEGDSVDARLESAMLVSSN